jgi:nitroreductase
MTMSLDEAILRRRSVRAFLPTPVSQTLLEEIFGLAQHAPSNCNTQPWSPHIVSGNRLAALRENLVAAAQAGQPFDPDWPAGGKYDDHYRERQFDAAARLYGAMGVDRHDKAGRARSYMRNHMLFDAPHGVFLFLRKPFDIREATDLGMYAQTLMLLLASRGIGSCAQGALGLYAGIVRRHLGLSEGHRLLFGISFGYADEQAPANTTRTPRAALGEAVRFHA